MARESILIGLTLMTLLCGLGWGIREYWMVKKDQKEQTPSAFGRRAAARAAQRGPVAEQQAETLQGETASAG